MASSHSPIPFTFAFFIRLVEKLTPSRTTLMPAAPPPSLLTNPLSLPALLPLSLRLVAAFFRFLISEGLILLLVPLDSASSSLPVIFSHVLLWHWVIAMAARPIASISVNERSPAKDRDHNSELCVYSGHVEFVDEFCYGGPVILDCNIASGGWGRGVGEVGNSRSSALQNRPTQQHHPVNTAPLVVTFLNTERIGITSTQEIAVVIHTALKASRLGWVHRS